MPVLRLYLHGATGGMPPGSTQHPRALRGDVGGWSAQSIRSNLRFLRSVDVDRLDGVGLSFTGTVLQCPPSHADWHRLRRAFFKRLERKGLVRAHWVTEWQRRAMPHLHGALWFEGYGWSYPELVELVRGQWLAVAGRYGAQRAGQHVGPIFDALGWFQYVSKHAARGLWHYQRSPEGIPPGWQRTGRMWGYVGSWDVVEGLRLRVDRQGFFRYRRMVRSWRRADARKAQRDERTRRRRIAQARRMLRCGVREQSEVRGVSEWVKLPVSLRMLEFLAASGAARYEVQQ